MKIWILVYVCRSTRAVDMYATTGYSTDQFLLKHKEFVWKHGEPQTIVSDRGTNLVKAGMVLSEDSHPTNWNWAKIVEQNKASNWTFTEIGSSWRNGLAESMVKQTKLCLRKAVPEDAKISYGEFVTLLAGISYTINSRPIGVQGSQNLNEEIQPITPNMLLLGRSDLDVKHPIYEPDQNISLPRRSAFVKELLDKWWSAWIRQVFPNLIPCKKWKEASKNLEVDDICLLYFPGALTGQYKLVRVAETHPDERGLVRTVSILYVKKNSTSLVKEKVGVQRLVLIQPASDRESSNEENEES